MEIITASEFKHFKNIGHGVFTRQGGVSTGQYHSLNCAFASQDPADTVRENRRRATSYLGYPLDSLVTVKNVHGNTVAVVDKPWTEHQKPEADAMVTQLKNVILGSDTADCPSVLLADNTSDTIGLAHAGWRGAKNGILEETVQQMTLLGANPTHITAVIGPCIAQKSYEVGPEFYELFLSETVENRFFFLKNPVKLNHFFFDLQNYVKAKLTHLGLKNVSAMDMDTYTDEKRFYSCRRSLHKGELDFGGHLAFIYLK